MDIFYHEFYLLPKELLYYIVLLGAVVAANNYIT